jgi:hypothetical protein
MNTVFCFTAKFAADVRLGVIRYRNAMSALRPVNPR